MAKTKKTGIESVPKPDRTMRLAETTGLLLMVARPHVELKGFYTFTDVATGEKVMVLP